MFCRRHSSDQDVGQIKDSQRKKDNPSTPLQRGSSKDKNGCTNQKIAKLYWDKKAYEQSMRKKAKKERKQRLENLQTLQNCIDKDDTCKKDADQGNGFY